MRKIMLVFGTRPEAIKMCPLVNELKRRPSIETVVCVTGQHRQMLDQVLAAFSVVPDYDLAIMKEKQTLFDVTAAILEKLRPVLESVRPDVVLVHGDTTTTFAAALACFYLQIPVGHVEAGLRTYNLASPYPEEFNRQAVSIVARYNFAPTETAREHLTREGRDPATIYVTGNTAIDALKTTVRENYAHPELDWASDSRLILITAHRRENLGAPMHSMFRAIRRIIDEHPDVKAIYPIHMNPIVRAEAEAEPGGCSRIHSIQPPEALDFHNFLARSYMVLTDSGGIQEKRRRSASRCCHARLRRTPRGDRRRNAEAGRHGRGGHLCEFQAAARGRTAAYAAMSRASNPYGDGHASRAYRRRAGGRLTEACRDVHTDPDVTSRSSVSACGSVLGRRVDGPSAGSWARRFPSPDNLADHNRTERRLQPHERESDRPFGTARVTASASR